ASSRAPPSRNTAKIAPPTISSSGWPSTMTPRMARPIPNHTAALAISRRTRGSRNSAGPGRSIWGSVVGGVAVIYALIVPQRLSGAAGAKRLEPADRVPPHRRSVEREGDELGAPADILPRHRPAESAAPFGHPAVGGIVAVVAHQPDVAGWDRHRSEIVLVRWAELDRLVAMAVGQSLAHRRHPAVHLPVRLPHAEIIEGLVAGRPARRVDVDRDHVGGHRPALHRLAVDVQLSVH